MLSLSRGRLLVTIFSFFSVWLAWWLSSRSNSGLFQLANPPSKSDQASVGPITTAFPQPTANMATDHRTLEEAETGALASPQPTTANMLEMWLDHIIILIPYKELVEGPEWATSHFVITPGGRHADGKTENKLILFQDGTYIELIAFVDDDPKNREGHWWGDKKFGIIDFAFKSRDVEYHHDHITERLEKLNSGLGITYQEPVEGGRKRPDGEELKWTVTFPQNALRGEVPFFCHDITPWELRVPMTMERIEHPSKVWGIKEMTIIVPNEKVDELAKVYSAVLNQKNEAKMPGLGYFEIATPYLVDDTEDPILRIQGADGEVQERLVVERGVLIGQIILGGFSWAGTGELLWLVYSEDAGFESIMIGLDPPPGWEIVHPE